MEFKKMGETAKASKSGEGLEDVVAASSSVCSIEDGVLRYRGIDIHELAQKSNFAETLYLLWNGKLPTEAQLQALTNEIDQNTVLPEPILKALHVFPKSANFMDILRTAVSLMGCYDPQAEDNSAEANKNKALRLLAQLPTLITAWEHIETIESRYSRRKALA